MRTWPKIVVISTVLLSAVLTSSTTTSVAIISIPISTTLNNVPLPVTTVYNGFATCQSFPINYISPGLPQQCLRARVKKTSENPPVSTIDDEGLRSNSSAITSSSLTTKLTIVSPTTTTVMAITSSTWSSSSYSSSTDAEDSLLDNVKFLSFEEWKAQNLAKAGQSSESFAERGTREPRRGAPGAGNGALDSLGDDIEIDLGGFGSRPSVRPETMVQVQASGSQNPSTAPTATAMPRSKNAGKTCKERFNYASFDCAATVHKTNKEGKGGNNILVENKDTYMLNRCNANKKYFIVELCEDILIDTVVLANFEFFSSVFKELQVSVSDRYPINTNGWKGLGKFTAKNTRDVQAFLIENPLIWARYIKIDLLSHYGNEFYCPLSLFRVHGTTMMEEFRHHVGVSRGEILDDVREEVVPEHIADPVRNSEESGKNFQAKVTSSSEKFSSVLAEPQTTDIADWSQDRRLIFAMPPLICLLPEKPRQPIVTTASNISSGILSSIMYAMSADVGSPTSVSLAASLTSESDASLYAATTSPDLSVKTVPQLAASYPLSTSLSLTPSPRVTTTISKNGNAVSGLENKPSLLQPPIATPSTQESFFKSVHKRLTHLEANTTLSFQYIEEQSRMLRDAFTKMEKKQISKVEHMLEQLNASAFTDLKIYREKYDQLWQSTVIALESQREHSDRELLVISSRLALLADEVIFQKRLYQINTILLLITIGVVLFGRGDGRLAVPLVQHLRTRSSMRTFETPPNSPPQLNVALSSGSSSPRPLFYRADLAESQDRVDAQRVAVELGPSTPPHDYPFGHESSPVIFHSHSQTASTSTPPNSNHNGDSRKGWIKFSPHLHLANRGRRSQPSPRKASNIEDQDETNGEPGLLVYPNGNNNINQES